MATAVPITANTIVITMSILNIPIESTELPLGPHTIQICQTLRNCLHPNIAKGSQCERRPAPNTNPFRTAQILPH